jgi:hypothetical protein
MMKSITLLVALIAAITMHGAQGACYTYFTRGQAGTSGAQKFTGITQGATTENYNNPMYYSQAAATTGFTATNIAKGRFSGKLLKTTFTGTMLFDFFSDASQISITFTKAASGAISKGTIKGGKVCYAGATSGTATRTTLNPTAPLTTPKIFKWVFCPNVARKCAPK